MGVVPLEAWGDVVSDDASEFVQIEAPEAEPRWSSDPKERAHQLVAAGKIGGARPGAGRPKHKRASATVSEKAREKAIQIAAVLEEGIKPDKPMSVRLAAVREWMAIERTERELQLKEDRNLEGLKVEDLIDLVAQRIGSLQAEGVVFEIEGEADEIVEPDGD